MYRFWRKQSKSDSFIAYLENKGNESKRLIFSFTRIHLNGGAEHTPPQPYLVPIQMEQLILDYAQMKQQKHIIEAVAQFHLRFEGIHPFIDGNGRTGRLLLNLELIKAGLLPVNIKFTDRLKYYDCFGKYHGSEHTALPLTELIADYEIEELKKHIAILEGRPQQ
mgnify:CR=1 FL=1